MSLICKRNPVGDTVRNMRMASSMLTNAKEESNSKCPASNTPVTVNCFRRGKTPAGVTCPCGTMTVSLSPGPMRRTRASSLPMAMLKELAGDIGNVGFFRWHDATHDDATHDVVAGDERLSDYIGGGTGHVWMFTDAGGGSLPVRQRAVDVLYFDMRQNRQHPVAHFFLETVHDGQDDDERGDAQRDTGHRDERDEGDEAVPAAAFSGTDVTQADKPFERQIGK